MEYMVRSAQEWGQNLPDRGASSPAGAATRSLDMVNWLQKGCRKQNFREQRGPKIFYPC